MLDWLILGGGIHGTYLSLYLTRRKGVAPERMRVLDPQPQPLALWKQFTANCGMEYLRSSHAHNLHFDPFSLVTFTRTQDGQPLARFIEPYGRPSLELFNAHCQRLITRYRLDELRLSGRALGLKRITDGWQVESDQGSLSARNIIVAFGNSERPYRPLWAQQTGASIYHLFDPAFDRQQLDNERDTVVVGGGITAAQFALAQAVRSLGRVTLLMRHLPCIHQFDADLGWITHQYLDDFHAETDYTRRRAMIQSARHCGSMPADVARELERAVELGLLIQRIDEVESVDWREDEVLSADGKNAVPTEIASGVSARQAADGKNAVPTESSIAVGTRFLASAATTLHLASGASLSAGQIVLATGFESSRPGGEWLDTAINTYGLPCAADGYPLVDRSLCWSPGLYVCGTLAELEVGPVARNLVGVKLAAEMIGATL